MSFISPLWLFALIPWAGVVFWLLWGRRRKTPVPFLELWRGPALQKPTRRAIQPPPIFVALTMLGTLLIAIAAGRPSLRVGKNRAEKNITIVVDRGISMSALSGSAPRFKIVSREASEQLKHEVASSTAVDVVSLPGNESYTTDIGAWAGTVGELLPTDVDTQALLEQTVRDRLANGTGPLVVISDRRLPFDDPRLIQFAPQASIENIGITKIAARETPSAEVMLRLGNDTDRTTVPVKIVSGSQTVTQTVNLPSRGQEQNYFFDLPKLNTVIEASIDARDEQPADDRAWLVRESSYPKIEVHTPLSAEVRRMIDVYSRARPSSQGSQTVAVVGAEADLPAGAPAIWVEQSSGRTERGEITTVAHPVTADLNAPSFPTSVRIAGDVPRGWTPVVSINARPIVAVVSDPVRKVWVGFESSAWAATPDFVIFWANVLTWAGQGQERFASYPLSAIERNDEPLEPAHDTSKGQLSPGLYRTSAGVLRAYNCPAVAMNGTARTTADWQRRLPATLGPERAGYEVGPLMLLLAIVCMIGSALTWKQFNLTPVSAGRTF